MEAALPLWVYEYAEAPRQKTPRADVPACELDTPSAIIAAIKYAKIAEPSIEGQGGDDNAYRVACKMRDLGVSEDTCTEILADEWNDRCLPPWNFEELQAKVGHAYQYARGQAGAISPEAITEMFTVIEEEKPADRPVPFFDYELDGEPPARKWIVQDWLPQGEVSSLYGDGGQGKTLLAEQLGFCVSRGLPFLGLLTAKMPVFAALAEDDRDEVHRRLSAIRKAYSSPPKEESYFRIFAFPSENYILAKASGEGRLVKGPFYDLLVSFLEEMPEGPKFLILDTLADMFDGNENIRNQANRFIKNVLRGLCAKYETTILMLAHPSRSGMAAEDNLSGSTAWNNAVRNRITLTSHKVLSDVRILTRVKSNYARSGDTITLCWQAGVFVVINEAEALREAADTHEEVILKALEEAAKEEMPFGDSRNHGNNIFNSLSRFSTNGKPIDKALLKSVLDCLIASGKVVRVKGKYRGNGLYPADFERDD